MGSRPQKKLAQRFGLYKDGQSQKQVPDLAGVFSWLSDLYQSVWSVWCCPGKGCGGTGHSGCFAARPVGCLHVQKEKQLLVDPGWSLTNLQGTLNDIWWYFFHQLGQLKILLCYGLTSLIQNSLSQTIVTYYQPLLANARTNTKHEETLASIIQYRSLSANNH